MVTVTKRGAGASGRTSRSKRDKPAMYWMIRFGPILAVLLAFAVYNYDEISTGPGGTAFKAPLRVQKYSLSRMLLGGGDGDGDDDDDDKHCADYTYHDWPGGCDDFFDTCADADSEINYQKLVSCKVHGFWVYVVYVVLIAEMLVLFYILGDTADVYFSPALMSISDLLHMSPSLAGVTFLALGNGAPDVFSQAAALLDSSGDGASLGLANALGGGIFVTTVVMGAVALVNEKKINRRPFIRDVVFYLGAMAGLAYFATKGSVDIAEAAAFLIYYVVYVMVVVVSRVIFQIAKKHRRKARRGTGLHEPLVEAADVGEEGYFQPVDSGEESEEPEEPMLAILRMRHNLAHDGHHRSRANSEPMDPRDQYLIAGDLRVDPGQLAKRNAEICQNTRVRSASDTLVSGGAYVEFDDNLTWEARRELIEERKKKGGSMGTIGHLKEMYDDFILEFLDRGCFSKCFFMLEVPLRVMRNLTIPAMDEGDWNRIYAVLNPFCSTVVFFVFLHMWNHYYIMAGFCVAGLIVSAIIFFVSDFDGPPRFYSVMSLWAFVMSVLWIYKVASELVEVLSTIGLALSIPKSVLGITVLAWGNSLGDLIADVAIAKAGEPAMAVAGVYAGPLFNLLIGMGGPLLVVTIKSGPYTIVPANDGNLVYYLVTFGCLFSGLIISLVVVPLSSFKPNKLLGILLLGLYLVFLPANVALSIHYGIGLDDD